MYVLNVHDNHFYKMHVLNMHNNRIMYVFDHICVMIYLHNTVLSQYS